MSDITIVMSTICESKAVLSVKNHMQMSYTQISSVISVPFFGKYSDYSFALMYFS